MRNNLTIALAGNANVGKSCIFNQLIGFKQVVGNWPGKTVEKAEGRLIYNGININVIDLPGIYSFSTYSQEEIISRDYIALEHPDVVINVVDATALERNLFLTLQLLEMGISLVVSLNLVDEAKKKGLDINVDRLQDRLGVPVVPTIASKGVGVKELIDKVLFVASDSRMTPSPDKIRYGVEIEKRIDKLYNLLEKVDVGYPLRWTAIKLLEGDQEIIKIFEKDHPEIAIAARILSEEIEHIHREPCSIVIASERYALASSIVKDVLIVREPVRPSLGERFESFSLHYIWGYIFMFFVMLSILFFISFSGGFLSGVLEDFFNNLKPGITGLAFDLFWNGGVVGFYASLSVALGFILPFYIILGILEDSGYLPRIAYLMDRPFHSIGLHGKACIPLIVAFGCNVPACVGCRIMETRRDRLIATVLSTLVPCSARTVVIIGLVGVYLGVEWALLLYVIDFVLIFCIGKILNKYMRGASVGIIMEMPSYRMPSLNIILKQAWYRFKPFLITATPLIIIGSVIIEAMRITGLIDIVSNILSPITVVWLGLPAFTGFLLIFGVLRKEAALVLLVTIAGTSNINVFMSPLQMIVFTLVVMIYIPCVATIAALIRETGWKNTFLIVAGEITLAFLIGGIAYRILNPFM
ncbi:MAG: ferrous iron transport protein B [Candidatus Thermoplasmatota archaeon]